MAQLTLASVRLVDVYPTHWRGLIIAQANRLLDHGPVAGPYPDGKFIDGHAIDARRSLVGSNLLPGVLEISPVQYGIE